MYYRIILCAMSSVKKQNLSLTVCFVANMWVHTIESSGTLLITKVLHLVLTSIRLP